MKKSAIRSFLALSLVFLFAVSAMAADINLSVAASLTDVVTELANTFAKKNTGVRFQNNFGASGALAKQMEAGAPVDIFFSANLEWVDYLKKKGLLDDKSINTFAYNVLVFAGKPGLKVNRLQDIVGLQRIAIGSPASVPCGEYAMDAFKNAGIDKQLQGKLVMGRDVRECLLYADRGEADGAFVYKTDVEQAAMNVKVLFTVPQDLNPRVTYPMALTSQGSKKPEAVAFYKFLQSDDAKTVLKKYGFPIN